MTSAHLGWPRHTEHLVLRPPTDDDLDQLLGWRNHPDVARWLLRTVVDPTAYRAAWRASSDDPWDHSVVALAGDEVVATVSLEVRDGASQLAHDSPASGCEALLGYLVDPAHHGRGYATEAVRSMLDLAFGELGLRRVTAGCFADNVGSWRVMEKVGMRREQHSVRDAWHAERGWLDGYTYAVLADEWR
jgi:RimJ/RimL family protein N-acetyltransferase